MNNGITGIGTCGWPPPEPYGLLGSPTPVPMPNASGLFDPRQLDGCTGWWDASNPETLTLNGTAVAQWRNLGSAGGAYTQETEANRPAMTTFGYRPAILFSQGTQMTGGPTPQSLGDQAGNVLIAFFLIRQTVNAGATARFWSIPSSQATTGFGLYSRLIGDFFWDASETGARVRGSATAMDAGPVVARFTRAQNIASIHVNATRVAFRSEASGSLTAPHGPQATILGYPSFATNTTTCAELITYSRPLFANEIVAIERYLGNKYGISVP